MLRKVNYKHLIFIFLFLFSAFTSCGNDELAGKIFVIGRDRTFTPLNLLGKESNLLAFTDDLIFRIAQSEGFKVNIVNTTRDEMLEDLDQGRLDATISSLSPDMRQRLKYDFSDPYFLIGPIIVVPVDSKITSYKDLSNKIVGVTKGMRIAFDVNADSTIIFTPYENILFALRNLASNQIDAIIMDAPSAIEYISSFYPNELKVLWPPLTQDGLRLVTHKTSLHQKLIERFNAGLTKLKDDGTYYDLLAKWGLYDPDIVDELRQRQTE